MSDHQWHKGGVIIPGATLSSYTINNISASDAGSFYVIVSGTSPCSPVTSSTAILTVNQAVAIITQPESQILCSGNNVTFNVVSTGDGLTYQWQKGGVNIPGAISASYGINNINTTDAGSYRVIVAGIKPCLPVASTAAILTINQAEKEITTQPASQTLCSGSTATLSIVATGTGLTYQWQKNGTDISGATLASLTLNNISTTDAGNYLVIVTGINPCSPINSSATVLTVNEAVVITNQPVSQALCSGDQATFSIIATGTGLTYQWQKGGVNIAGATSSSYTINNVNHIRCRKL